MTEMQIVKVDQGGVNAPILAKQTKAGLRRIKLLLAVIAGVLKVSPR